MNRNSKRAIASVAALQILIYHCLIPVTAYGTVLGEIERFLIAATYFGVDVFFFISAYSLVSHPVENYRDFLINRSIKLIPPFIIALIFGQFLWFIPSIMVMYILLPPLHRICSKRPLTAFVLLMAVWVEITCLILGVIKPGWDVGLFLFRIPSIILGAYAVRFMEYMRQGTRSCEEAGRQRDVRSEKKAGMIAGVLLLAAGMLLIYLFGYRNRLNYPFRGTFYLMGIPAMLGLVLLVGNLASDRKSRFLSFFGGITLELYFIQMVVGTQLVNLFFGLTGSRILTNIATIGVIIAISALVKIINEYCKDYIEWGRENIPPKI